MQGLTQAVWNFMETAYRKGFLDELLDLLAATGGWDLDLGQQLGRFEDRLAEADFGTFETVARDLLPPLLEALAREEVMDSLQVLVATWWPLVGGKRGVVDRMNGGGGSDWVRKNLMSLRVLVRALLPVGIRFYWPRIQRVLAERGPALAAELTDRVARAIQAEPEGVRSAIRELTERLDPGATRTAVDTVVEAFLDRNPPLLLWAVGMVARRTKKRLLRS